MCQNNAVLLNSLDWIGANCLVFPHLVKLQVLSCWLLNVDSCFNIWMRRLATNIFTFNIRHQHLSPTSTCFKQRVHHWRNISKNCRNQWFNKCMNFYGWSYQFHMIMQALFSIEYYCNARVDDELSGRVSYTFFLIVRLVNIPCNPKQRSF